MKNLWQDSCAEALSCASFSGTARADLVVIGGGFTGCSAALQAAKMGARVILLEAHRIGHGGSGRNVGLVNAGLWLPPDVVEAQMGAAGARLNQILAEAPDLVFNLIDRFEIRCEATRNGTLHCAHSARGRKDLETRFHQQNQRGAPVALHDAAAARQLVGSDKVHGALQDARAGTIQPLAYVIGLARAAQALGAQIHEASAVTALTRDGDGWRVETAAGHLLASAVLVAGNAYAEAAAAEMTPKTSTVHYFQLATAPMDKAARAKILPQLQGCWDTGLIMRSFRRDAAGRLVFGAMGRPDALGLHRSWAERALGQMFPQLAEAQTAAFWSGRIAMTQDHIPKILKPAPNALCIFGYSGRGIGPGSVFGNSAATALLTGAYDDLPVPVVERYDEAFTRVKSLFYEAGARVIHGVDW